jgi:hypothetical protein
MSYKKTIQAILAEGDSEHVLGVLLIFFASQVWKAGSEPISTNVATSKTSTSEW